MKSLKERLDEKIEKDATIRSKIQCSTGQDDLNKAIGWYLKVGFEDGAASLLPLVVELAECLSKISKQKYGLQGYIEEGDNEGAYSYMSQLAFGYETDARKALQSIEKFVEGK